MKGTLALLIITLSLASTANCTVFFKEKFDGV
jgi:hypothetical protein